MKRYLKLFFAGVLIFSCKNSKRDLRDRSSNSKLPLKEQYFKNIADSFYDLKQYPKSVFYYDSLIHLDSSNGEYFFKRGYSYDMIYQKQGLNEAVSDYLKSIDLGYNKESGYYNLGVSYMYINDSIALYYFNKCYDVNPYHRNLLMLTISCKKRLTDKNPG